MFGNTSTKAFRVVLNHALPGQRNPMEVNAANVTIAPCGSLVFTGPNGDITQGFAQGQWLYFEDTKVTAQ